MPTVINGDAISEVGYVLGTSADNFRSAYLEAAFVDNLVSFSGVLRWPPSRYPFRTASRFAIKMKRLAAWRRQLTAVSGVWQL